MSPEERAALLERRAVEFPQRWPNDPDFCPADGICWNCKTDLVEQYSGRFPRIYISGCSVCRRSFCD